MLSSKNTEVEITKTKFLVIIKNKLDRIVYDIYTFEKN